MLEYPYRSNGWSIWRYHIKWYGDNAISADNQQERPNQKRTWIFPCRFCRRRGKFLRIIKDVLGCGIIKVRKKDNLYSYDVTKPKDIIQKVIPFFRKFPLLSDSKKINFEIFCKIARLMDKGEHKTLFGLKKILELRELINEGSGRTRKYGIKDVFPD